MQITSPELSFLNFNQTTENGCLTEDLQPLEVCDNLKIKAQINVITESDLEAETNPIFIGICDDSCNVVYENDIQIEPICSKYKFKTLFEDDEEIGTDNQYNLCSEDEPIEQINFEPNPFDLITSTDLTFVQSFTYAGALINVTYRQLQLYCEGNVYVINWSITQTDGYVYSQVGNVYYVSILFGTTLSERIRLRQFLQAVFDVNHGTTTTFDLGTNTMTIANIPSGSYISNYAFASSINTVTTSTNSQLWMHWNNGSIIYYSSTSIPSEVSFSFEQTLTDSQPYQFYFDLFSFYNDFEIEITIDDGVSNTVIFNGVPHLGNSTIDTFYSPTLSGIHTIKIEIINVSGHTSGFEIRNISKQLTLIYNVTSSVSIDGYAPIPVGLYSKKELKDKISELLGINFECEFISCCEIPNIEFEITTEDGYFVYFLTKYWQKGYINFPEVDTNVVGGKCFTYCILDSADNVIACSNLFRITNDCCYISGIEYSNKEDAFGFSYPNGISNYIQLPFFLHSPNPQIKEKVYRQTNGEYRRLSADIEKEYEVETDYMDELTHDKLIVSLKHDKVRITSNRLGFTEDMVQQGDYKIDWNSKIDFTAKAEFSLRKYFNGKNNNCEDGCN